MVDVPTLKPVLEDLRPEGPEDLATTLHLGAVARPRVRGKFVHVGEQKLHVRGVTYGTFRPTDEGDYPEAPLVELDFAQMTENGVNALRTYSTPPIWLLDLAYEHGLYVMVGLPWEQHVAFLDGRSRADSITRRVREGVRACAGHPAVLCYAVGNEIPAPIVRWHGRRKIERFIHRLYEAAKDEDPEALVTYVNYPSTEYLQLPFVDLVAVNVYLEDHEEFDAYLARLQNLAGDRALLIAEIGLDSLRHGERAQAELLGAQIRTTAAEGCAGSFVFAWTDDWHRGGHDVDDWAFGLTTCEREPKVALAAVRDAFAEVPFSRDVAWPSLSVVVCCHNGEATLRGCLAGVANLDYPDFECIVVDDGSTDRTAAIAEEFEFHLIRTSNGGLANARNRGLAAAKGEIVAYLDDDASPDPQWLRYLAATFMRDPHAAVGGPNIPPEGDGIVADCVARAPGGPTHVLISNREAEHIPGCNMAFRKEALVEIGGFDPEFRVAGDDVDVCWRLRDRGWTIGFSPAAVVWHHRRSSLRAYFRQQRGYGEAEALLERKWPAKYNRGGHTSWAGRVYGGPYTRPAGRRWHVYYGTWGSSLFQSIYERTPGTLGSLPLTPEWYLLIAALALAAGYESAWKPLLFHIPGSPIPPAGVLLILSVVPLVARATARARAAWRYRGGGLGPRAVTAFLYLGQPLARLFGRLRRGLTPWRRRGRRLSLPRPRVGVVWSENWRSLSERLSRLENELGPHSTGVLRGGDFDRWDLQVRTGALGAARLQLTVEEHGEGRQLLRYRIWPRPSRGGGALTVALLALAGLSFGLVRYEIAAGLAAGATLLTLRMLLECAAAAPLLLDTLEGQPDPSESLGASPSTQPPGAPQAPAGPVDRSQQPVSALQPE